MQINPDKERESKRQEKKERISFFLMVKGILDFNDWGRKLAYHAHVKMRAKLQAITSVMY